MLKITRRLHIVFVALIALAFSASLAFAAKPAVTGLERAAEVSGKTVPVAGTEETTEPEEDVEGTEEEEDEDTEEATEEAGDHCATDPTTLTPEQLAELNHGAVVCWAAHQTEWPEWFSNHGAFVSCWAHQGKADAVSCTEDPTTVTTTEAGASKGKGKGHGKPDR